MTVNVGLFKFQKCYEKNEKFEIFMPCTVYTYPLVEIRMGIRGRVRKEQVG